MLRSQCERLLNPRSGFRHHESELKSLSFRIQASLSELLVKIYATGSLFYGNSKLEVSVVDSVVSCL